MCCCLHKCMAHSNMSSCPSENQVGALEMISRQLQDQLMEAQKKPTPSAASPWGLAGMFTARSPDAGNFDLHPAPV